MSRYVGDQNMSDDDDFNHDHGERIRPLSPTRQPSRTRYGREAPAAQYFASKPVRSARQQQTQPLDDDEFDIEINPRRRQSHERRHGYDEYARNSRVLHAGRPVHLRPTLEEDEDHDDFASKVATFQLPGLSLTQLSDVSGSIDEEREAASKPSRAFNVYQSQYTGDGVMEGLHSINLTVRHDTQGPQEKSPCLFRWL